METISCPKTIGELELLAFWHLHLVYHHSKMFSGQVRETLGINSITIVWMSQITQIPMCHGALRTDTLVTRTSPSQDISACLGMNWNGTGSFLNQTLREMDVEACLAVSMQEGSHSVSMKAVLMFLNLSGSGRSVILQFVR